MEAGTTTSIIDFIVSDVDVAEGFGFGELEVSVIVENGSLSLVSEIGLSFVDNYSSSTGDTLIFSGLVADINTALTAGLVYQTACANGDETLTFIVKDFGDNGQGPGGEPFMELEASTTVAVHVQDTTLPTANLATGPILKGIDEYGHATFTLTELFADISDNCGVTSQTISKSADGCFDLGLDTDTTVTFTCFDTDLSLEVTLTVTDVNGNVATFTTQNLMVFDNLENNYCGFDCSADNDSLGLVFTGRRLTVFTPPVRLEYPMVADAIWGDENQILPRARVYTRNESGSMLFLRGASELIPGQGYYVRSGERQNKTVTFKGCDVVSPVRKERAGTWPAFFTGNPYDEHIPLTNFVLPDMGFAYYMVRINSAWRTDVTMVPPGAGVFIYTYDTCLEIWKDAPTLAEDGVIGEDNGWLLNLHASAGDLVDKDNYLGVHKDANRSYDPDHDFPELLAQEEEYVRVGFQHEDWLSASASLFQKDVRSPFEGSEVWDIEVEANTGETEVTLSWPNLSTLDHHLQFTLINQTTGDRIDMRENNFYTISHTGALHSIKEIDSWDTSRMPLVTSETTRLGEIYPFRIEVISSENLDSATPSSDWSYRLDQNMPNPFAPMTTISYQVPTDQHVRVQVFNIAGQLIQTLVDDHVAAGDHSVVWDGSNDRGQSVESGVYFYQMSSDGFTSTKRMILMK